MKKRILFLSFAIIGILFQQCREDEKNESITEQAYFRKIQDSTKTDSINHTHQHKIWELDPDPPVRDGQDWKQ